MSPSLALIVFAGGIVGLFYLDREPKSKTSPGLWLPVIWLSLLGSRSVSQWLGASTYTVTPDQYLEGSPMDAVVLTGLIVAGLGVLARRGSRTREILARNVPLLVFLLYCVASMAWSDFPLTTLKRWTKALGSITMILIVLTDPDSPTAFRQFLTRTAFLLIPTSILLIKYFPDWGRYYDRWEGTTFYSGVATDKNVLGCICLVLGLGILWRLLHIPKDSFRSRRLLSVGIVMAMNLWLFSIANSATSTGCFALGGVIVFVLSRLRRERVSVVHFVSGVLVGVAFVAYFFGDAFALLAGFLGRNSTLTGRTDLWNDLTQMNTTPWFGVGFESFFLGPRLDLLWNKYWWHPNEAHNGYLETYLTLGRVGLGLLLMLVVTGYRNVLRHYRVDPSAGSLRLAFLVVTMLYNVTESAFKVMHPLWLFFMVAVTAMPEAWCWQPREADSVPAVDHSSSAVLERLAVSRQRKREDRQLPAGAPVQNNGVSRLGRDALRLRTGAGGFRFRPTDSR